MIAKTQRGSVTSIPQGTLLLLHKAPCHLLVLYSPPRRGEVVDRAVVVMLSMLVDGFPVLAVRVQCGLRKSALTALTPPEEEEARTRMSRRILVSLLCLFFSFFYPHAAMVEVFCF